MRRVPVRTGAVVLGGDYQGLGIVRSLGRHGIPSVIVDDETSIARTSRYAMGSVRVETLRDDDSVLRALTLAGPATGSTAGFSFRPGMRRSRR
jgi:predicted ATP-grasp superfamily ATP-dependent carboligase